MFDACGKVKCLFYGTILLINFIKIVNVVFILFPRLHTNTLTSYSIMNGKMAAQVLSSTVSNVFFQIMLHRLLLKVRNFVQ